MADPFEKGKSRFEALKSFGSRAFLSWVVTAGILWSLIENATDAGMQWWSAAALTCVTSVYILAQKVEDVAERKYGGQSNDSTPTA